MEKPRIFLGSSGKQAKLVQALTRGLEDCAHVDPWTTSFNPGTTTLERLAELAHEVDFAAFVFAQDDWTAINTSATPSSDSGQASPRDNVVFEAGLFGDRNWYLPSWLEWLPNVNVEGQVAGAAPAVTQFDAAGYAASVAGEQTPTPAAAADAANGAEKDRKTTANPAGLD